LRLPEGFEYDLRLTGDDLSEYGDFHIQSGGVHRFDRRVHVRGRVLARAEWIHGELGSNLHRAKDSRVEEPAGTGPLRAHLDGLLKSSYDALPWAKKGSQPETTAVPLCQTNHHG